MRGLNVFVLWPVFLLLSCSSGNECTYDTDCPGSKVCIDGKCVAHYPQDCPDRDCADGFFCVDGTCVEQACLGVNCPEGEACAGGECYPQDCESRTCPGIGEVCVEEECASASCVDVECPQGQRCAGGDCYPVDCETKECPGYGEVCIQGECVQSNCVGVTCPEGQRCANGYCYPEDCTEIGCSGEGQVCVDGVCQRSSCVDVDCEVGFLCANGWCYPTLCAGVPCGAGEVCVENECVDADCVGLTCPPGDLCVNGHCVPVHCEVDDDCYDGNPCTSDSCDPAQGCQYQDAPGSCNDGDACTMDDRCEGGVCVGDPLDVDGDGSVSVACGGDDCDDDRAGVHPGAAENCSNGLDDDCDGLTDQQDPACGECSTDGDCSDGNACNGQERCVGGHCTGGTAPDCDDDNACTEDGCDQTSGCTHSDLPDGTDCGSRTCSGLEWRQPVCQEGSCSGAVLIQDCDDGNACTDDACNPSSGCANPAVADGTDCNTGANSCLTGPTRWSHYTCQSGTCTNVITTCNDDEDCTDNTCEVSTGCAFIWKPDGNSCGPTPNMVCCSGVCRYINSDDQHCGGCNQPCASGYYCQDVSQTSGCSYAPEDTSGRCTCDSDSHCPNDQICILSGYYYIRRCSPDGNRDNCPYIPHAAMYDMDDCPDFCYFTYP
jgi:hypothetical protein